MLDESFIDAISRLLREVSSNTKPIQDADALEIRDRIVSKIPEELRFLYPEDDTLAALVFAEVYYNLHLEEQ